MTVTHSAAFDVWIARAKSVPIEAELKNRGYNNLKKSGGELIGPCPQCGGDDRFGVNLKKQIFNCRQCGAAGDVIDLVKLLDGSDFTDAATTLAGEPPPNKPNGKDRTAEAKLVTVAKFRYDDENGKLLFGVVRKEYQLPDGSFVLVANGKRKKTFSQCRPDPERQGQWVWNIDGVRIVPYRLVELIEAIANGYFVIIVEGEAKVDLLRSWGVPATCCAMGAKKWKAEHSEYLRGADVIILPDNDQPGREHADIIGAALQGIAASIRVLNLPNLPPKGDVIDWANNGGTREQLDDLIEHQAKAWAPKNEQDKGEQDNQFDQTTAQTAEPNESEQTTPDRTEGISLDDFRAYMPQHNFIYTPSREPWPASSVNARIGPVALFDKKGDPVLNKKGEQETISASAWLDRNQPVEQATWAPGLPMLIPNRLIADGGWIEQPRVTCLNLYRPPKIIPGNAAEADLWLDHVHKIYPDDAGHIIRWLAHRVQRPADKINHALVLGGKQGIGKDTLLEPLKRAVLETQTLGDGRRQAARCKTGEGCPGAQDRSNPSSHVDRRHNLPVDRSAADCSAGMIRRNTRRE